MILTERIGNAKVGVVSHNGKAYICFNGLTAGQIRKGMKLVR